MNSCGASRGEAMGDAKERQGAEGCLREVVYGEAHWRLLKLKRDKALFLMRALKACGLHAVVVHGSLARGDVREDSDVDVALLAPAPVGLVMQCLQASGYTISSIKVVQATPRHTPKVLLVLDPREEVSVSIPLAKLSPLEIEYYKFSGMLELEGVEKGLRVRGVDKRLMLIEPTDRGHVECPVRGREGFVSRLLNIPIWALLDRVEALERRLREGHTGLFLDTEVPVGVAVEAFVEDLCRENQYFRKKVTASGLCI